MRTDKEEKAASRGAAKALTAGGSGLSIHRPGAIGVDSPGRRWENEITSCGEVSSVTKLPNYESRLLLTTGVQQFPPHPKRNDPNKTDDDEKSPSAMMMLINSLGGVQIHTFSDD